MIVLQLSLILLPILSSILVILYVLVQKRQCYNRVKKKTFGFKKGLYKLICSSGRIVHLITNLRDGTVHELYLKPQSYRTMTFNKKYLKYI
jgi:hypothetical protein